MIDFGRMVKHKYKKKKRLAYKKIRNKIMGEDADFYGKF